MGIEEKISGSWFERNIAKFLFRNRNLFEIVAGNPYLQNDYSFSHVISQPFLASEKYISMHLDGAEEITEDFRTETVLDDLRHNGLLQKLKQYNAGLLAKLKGAYSRFREERDLSSLGKSTAYALQFAVGLVPFAALGFFGCGGNTSGGNGLNPGVDAGNSDTNGYTDVTQDVPIVYDQGSLDVEPDTVLDVPVNKDEYVIPTDEGITWLDSDDLVEEKDDETTIEDLLKPTDDRTTIEDLLKPTDEGKDTFVPPTDDGKDTNVDKDEGIIPDVPVVEKYNVTLNIEDILSGQVPEILNYYVKDNDGNVVASGVGGVQVFKLKNGQYSVLVTDNPTKITEFEYTVGKKLGLTGDYLTDFNNVLTTLSAEGFDNSTINVKLTEFNKQYIGSYFDLEFKLDVTEDMDVKKQIIKNNDLDVPLVLDDGTVNAENTLYFMLKVWSLQPLTSDGYTKPGQWDNAPNPLKVYIEQKSSLDELNKDITIVALNSWNEKAGTSLYQLVDDFGDAQVSVVFDPNATNSKTKFDKISLDSITGNPVLEKMTVIIKPKSTYPEILHTVSHEFHHVFTGTGELFIVSTVGNNSSQKPTETEGYNVAIAFNTYIGFSTLEHISK